MVITGLTRNFTATWSFRPPEILDFKGFSKSKIEYFSVFSPAFLSKKFLSIKQTEIYGDVPKWLKGPHSKSYTVVLSNYLKSGLNTDFLSSCFERLRFFLTVILTLFHPIFKFAIAFAM